MKSLIYVTLELPSVSDAVIGGVGESSRYLIPAIRKVFHIKKIVTIGLKDSRKKFLGVKIENLGVLGSKNLTHLDLIRKNGHKKIAAEFIKQVMVHFSESDMDIVYLQGIELGCLAHFFRKKGKLVIGHIQWLMSENIYQSAYGRIINQKKIKLLRFISNTPTFFLKKSLKFLYNMPFLYGFLSKIEPVLANEFFLLRYSDMVLLPNEGNSQFLNSTYSPGISGKYCVVPSAYLKKVKKSKKAEIYSRGIIKKYKIKPDDFVIISLSRIHPQKGIERIFHSLPGLLTNADSSRIKLFIIGDATNEYSWYNVYLHKLSKKYDVPIFFVNGGVYGYKRDAFMKICKCFLLLSHFEPFGIAIIEALSNKKVVICSKTNGSVSILGENSKFVVDFSEKNAGSKVSGLLTQAYFGKLSRPLPLTDFKKNMEEQFVALSRKLKENNMEK